MITWQKFWHQTQSYRQSSTDDVSHVAMVALLGWRSQYAVQGGWWDETRVQVHVASLFWYTCCAQMRPLTVKNIVTPEMRVCCRKQDKATRCERASLTADRAEMNSFVFFNWWGSLNCVFFIIHLKAPYWEIVTLLYFWTIFCVYSLLVFS